jgi:hypothetical protein
VQTAFLMAQNLWVTEHSLVITVISELLFAKVLNSRNRPPLALQ